MPPRRSRASATSQTTEPPKKRTRRGAAATTAEPPASIPAKPNTTDTYRPKSRRTAEARKLVQQTLTRHSKENVPGTIQIRLSVSVTGAAVLQEQTESLQKETGALILVEDPVAGSVDVDVVITGTHKAVVCAMMSVAIALAELMGEVNAETTVLRLTLLVSSTVVKSIPWLSNEEALEVSEEFLPFSNYKTVHCSGTTQNLTVLLHRLVKNISYVSHDLQLDIAPEVKVPVTGTHVAPQKRSEANQVQLEKSKTLFEKFLKQDPSLTTTAIEEAPQQGIPDPLVACRAQLQEAINSCRQKQRSLSSMRVTVNVPVDYVAAIIGKGGSKINEIRAKSNSNVTVEDAVTQGLFRAVIITGLPEGNLTALQAIAKIVQ